MGKTFVSGLQNLASATWFHLAKNILQFTFKYFRRTIMSYTTTLFRSKWHCWYGNRWLGIWKTSLRSLYPITNEAGVFVDTDWLQPTQTATTISLKRGYLMIQVPCFTPLLATGLSIDSVIKHAFQPITRFPTYKMYSTIKENSHSLSGTWSSPAGWTQCCSIGGYLCS